MRYRIGLATSDYNQIFATSPWFETEAEVIAALQDSWDLDKRYNQVGSQAYIIITRED